MNIEGIPTSIARSRVDDLIEAMNIPLTDLLSLEVTLDAVKVEIAARDENGERYVGDRAKSLIATHTLCIPITSGVDQ